MKNKIIEGYLDRFMQDNGSFGKSSKDIIFEHLINYLIIKRYYIDDFDISDIHTGNSNDLSIDGIAIFINNFLATNTKDAKYLIDTQFQGKSIAVDFVFIQSKTSSEFDLGEILKFFHGVNEFFDQNGRQYNNIVKEFIEIQDYIFKNSSKFSRNPSIKLFYVALGKYEFPADIEAVKNKQITQLKDLNLFEDISINYMDAKNIIDLYKNVELKIKKDIDIQRVTTFPEAKNIKEAYIGVVKIADFINLISDEQGNLLRTLFYDNVRDYQGENSVNKEIIDTINHSSKQEYFSFFNNGITVVAKNLIRSGDKITIEDFQIVNGCQTSTIIYENKEKIQDKAYITIKIISTNDNDIINSIIHATNRQTEVKPEAFVSLMAFHKELEEFYNYFPIDEEHRLFYERRSKQYVQQDIQRYKVITLAIQINSYISVFLEQPHSTHRYYGELLKHNKIFQDNDDKHPYFASAYLLYSVENLFRKNILDFKYKIFKFHIIMLIRFHVCGEYTLQTNSKKNEEYCMKIIEHIKDNDIFVSTCKEIISKIEKIVLDKYGTYDKHQLIRLKDFTNSILSLYKHPIQNKRLRIIKKVSEK